VNRCVLALALTGCSELAFEGTVIDPFGAALPGVLVTSEPGRCAGTTNAQGIYYARCKPGRYTLTATLNGHFPHSVDVRQSERVLHPVDPLTLFPDPGEPGPWLLLEDGLRRPDPAPVERRDAPRERRYCLTSDAPTTTVVPAGETLLLDPSGSEYRLFELDDQDCARHEAWRAGEWRVASESVMELNSAPLGSGLRHAPELAVGDYLLAPWDSARFAVVSPTAPAEQTKRYAGFRITVE